MTLLLYLGFIVTCIAILGLFAIVSKYHKGSLEYQLDCEWRISEPRYEWTWYDLWATILFVSIFIPVINVMIITIVGVIVLALLIAVVYK